MPLFEALLSLETTMGTSVSSPLLGDVLLDAADELDGIGMNALADSVRDARSRLDDASLSSRLPIDTAFGSDAE